MISQFGLSFILLLVTTLVVSVAISASMTSIQQVGGFQQIAGPIIINVTPGETKSFSWGLVAGNNETSILKIYADGNG